MLQALKTLGEMEMRVSVIWIEPQRFFKIQSGSRIIIGGEQLLAFF